MRICLALFLPLFGLFFLPAQQTIHLEQKQIINNQGEGFSRIQSITVDAQGRIYLLDSKASCVYIFSADGSRLKHFSQKGEGPGDLTRPYQIALTDQGEVLVTESMNRVSYFTPDGGFKQTRRIQVNGTGFFSQIAFAGPGLFFGLDSQGDDSRVQKIINKDGCPLPITLYREESGRTGDGKVSYFFTNAAYSPYHLFAHNSGISAAALSTRYEIQLLDDQGRPIRKVSRELIPTVFTSAERVALEKEIDKVDSWPKSIRTLFKQKIPAHRSPISRLRLSPGLLWVFRTSADITRENAPDHVDIFSTEDGRLKGSYSLPGIPLFITADHLYMAGSDEEDLLQLEIFRYNLPQ